LRAGGLEALLVTHPPNILYLVNFHGSAGVLVVTRRGAVLFTDGRYATQARAEVRQARVVVTQGSLLGAAANWLHEARARRIGFEAARITADGYAQLRRSLGTSRLLAVRNLVEEMRAVKGAEEIAALGRAARLASRVFAEVLPLVRPGVRELDLAAEIDYRMKRAGAAGAAFETIVASGRRSALPHARASRKRLGRNELVVFDLGAILTDYCSDMTRTVFLGRPSARVRRLYACVREAQQRGFETVQAGVEAQRVDAAVRSVLRAHRLDRYFTHSTGHGVGLEIHEEPRLARSVNTRLVAGQVVTLEPGVYIPGWGGIRIEDLVVVRRGGAERLTPTPHDLITL
jgi:Xaa-Pro aminopeptidase